MNRFFLAALLCPLAGTLAPAQSPLSPGAGQELLAPGQFKPIPAGSDLALEARAFVQHALPGLGRIEVCEAYDAVVKGVKVKLVCAVAEGGAPSQWQFVVLHDLNAEWRLLSAERLGPVDGD